MTARECAAGEGMRDPDSSTIRVEDGDRYEALCAFLPWGYLVLDDAARIVEANAAAARLLGAARAARAALLGAPLRAFVTEDSVGPLIDALDHCRHAGLASDVALVVAGRDGRQRHVRLHAQAFGAAPRYHVALLDVTEARRAHLALRGLADELHDLYQNAPCGYHSLDPDGVVLQINDTELAWLGYRRDEIERRMRLTDLMLLSSHADFHSAFSALKQGARVRDLQVDMQRRDGSVFPALLSATAVVDRRGQFLSSRASVFDISRRRRAEEEARRYAQQLKTMSQRVVEAQEAERRRIALDLHDRVGQTLTALNINLDLINAQLAAPDAAVRARLAASRELVEATVDSIRSVIADLRPTVLDDYGLAAALRWYATQFSERTGLAVRVSGTDPQPRLPASTEATLFRIVQEALTNAAKHACAQSARVALEVSDACFMLSVADDGCGFDPARLCTPNNHHGWGLMFMRERAESTGGELRIESAAGQGTHVTVELKL